MVAVDEEFQLIYAGTAEIANGVRVVRLSLGMWRWWPSSRSLLSWAMRPAPTCGVSRMSAARWLMQDVLLSRDQK